MGFSSFRVLWGLILMLADASSKHDEVSVFYDATTKAFSSKPGILEDAAATGVFDGTEALNTGWGRLNVQALAGPENAAYYAAGMAEGLLTCEFVAAVSKNNDDAQQGSNAALLNYTLHTEAWARQNAATNMSDYWVVVGQILAQFDGLVYGYSLSNCSKETPLTSTQLFFMNMDGDLEDLKNKFPAPSAGGREVGSRRASWRPQHCSSLVKIPKDNSDIFFGHSTWDTYSNAAPRIFKTYTVPVTRGGSRVTHSAHFSSTGPWLSSVDDFYTVTGTAELGVMETSNTLIDERLYARVHPESMLSWMRVLLANRLATDGADWARIFGLHHSGTYTNQWQVVDLALFRPGEPHLTPGLLTVLEEVPGLLHTEDMTTHLGEQRYWPSYNVPYFEDIRALNGDTNGSWSTAPRAELFRKFQGQVDSVSSFQHLLRWNAYTTEPAISGGDPCNAIACRGDLRSAGSRPMAAFGAIDAKMSSYRTLFGVASAGAASAGASSNTLAVWAEAGPTHDEQAPFCWSATSFKDPHLMHPNCFNFSWQQLAPLV